MDFLLGLDGGGTKTDLVAAGLFGRVQSRWRARGTSLSRFSLIEVESRLRSACESVLSGSGRTARDCVAVCGGFASAGQHAPEYERLLQALLPRARVLVMTDAELAWRGATQGQDGIALISGTGSIAWGRYSGRQARSGGDGPGQDRGSGDWIGRQAVACGLLPEPADLDYAALVPLLKSDDAAAAIFRQAGAELATLLEDCARQLEWPRPVAYPVGGVLENVPEVLQHLRRAWPHDLARPRSSPLAAALEAARALLA